MTGIPKIVFGANLDGIFGGVPKEILGGIAEGIIEEICEGTFLGRISEVILE